MGACTSTEERRQNRQLHKRIDREKSLVLDNKHLSPIRLTIFRNQRPHSLATDLDLQSSSIEEPRCDPTSNNSLIQLYSLKTENNHHQPMSSPSSQAPPRIPVSKSRLSTHQLRPTVPRSLRPKQPPPSTLGLTSPTGSHWILLYASSIYTNKTLTRSLFCVCEKEKRKTQPLWVRMSASRWWWFIWRKKNERGKTSMPSSFHSASLSVAYRKEKKIIFRQNSSGLMCFFREIQVWTTKECQLILDQRFRQLPAIRLVLVSYLEQQHPQYNKHKVRHWSNAVVRLVLRQPIVSMRHLRRQFLNV